jgi:hypothetical protein
MTDALELVGLACLSAAAFLVAISFGLAVVGASCLAVSYKITRTMKARK